MAQEASASNPKSKHSPSKPASKAKLTVSVETAKAGLNWLLNNHWEDNKKKLNLIVARLFYLSIEDRYGIEKLIRYLSESRSPVVIKGSALSSSPNMNIFVAPFSACNNKNYQQLKRDFDKSDIEKFYQFLKFIRNRNNENGDSFNVYLAVFIGKITSASHSGKKKIAAHQDKIWHVRTLLCIVDPSQDNVSFWGIADVNDTGMSTLRRSLHYVSLHCYTDATFSSILGASFKVANYTAQFPFLRGIHAYPSINCLTRALSVTSGQSKESTSHCEVLNLVMMIAMWRAIQQQYDAIYHFLKKTLPRSAKRVNAHTSSTEISQGDFRKGLMMSLINRINHILSPFWLDNDVYQLGTIRKIVTQNIETKRFGEIDEDEKGLTSEESEDNDDPDDEEWKPTQRDKGNVNDPEDDDQDMDDTQMDDVDELNLSQNYPNIS